MHINDQYRWNGIPFNIYIYMLILFCQTFSQMYDEILLHWLCSTDQKNNKGTRRGTRGEATLEQK